MLLPQRFCEPRRAGTSRGDAFDIHRKGGHLSFGDRACTSVSVRALARMQAPVGHSRRSSKRWPEWKVDYDDAAMAHTSSVRVSGRDTPSSSISAFSSCVIKSSDGWSARQSMYFGES